MTATPNILLIVLDALRDDVAREVFAGEEGCLLAKESVAAAPWTLPSCTSLLTGMDPVNHGRYWRHIPIGRNSLLDALPKGFGTHGFVNNGAIGTGSGVETGFNNWKLSVDHDEPFERTLRCIRRTRSRKPKLIVLHSNVVHDFYLPVADWYRPGALRMDDVFNHGERIISWNGISAVEVEGARDTYRAGAEELADRVANVLAVVRERDDFVTAVTADHGEGFQPALGRVHHAGRVHQDLLRVPLLFDLPSALASVRSEELAAAIDDRPVFGSDVLPTLFDLAGLDRPVGVDGRSAMEGQGRTLVSEDKRYLYLRDRFRINYGGLRKNMSEADVVRNEYLVGSLAGPPSVRSFRRGSSKCVVTSLELNHESDLAARKKVMRTWAASLQGKPIIATKGNRLQAFELFDVSSDPFESSNLLEGISSLSDLLGQPWNGSITMPAPDGEEIQLAEWLPGCELLGGGALE